jgi:hypothetical protein
LAIDASTAFVSYSREDLAFVLRLAKDLKTKGAKVWMDKLDIRAGQRWEQEVETALKGCSRILVILSPASVRSPEVRNEVAFAIDKHKDVVPVLHLDRSSIRSEAYSIGFWRDSTEFSARLLGTSESVRKRGPALMSALELAGILNWCSPPPLVV